MSHELPGGFVKDIVGYCDPLSVRPGDRVGFKLSSYAPGPAITSLVRLISGDDRPHGTGLVEEPIDSDLPAEVDVQHQPLTPGSYAVVSGMPEVASGELSLWFYPTLVNSERQTLVSAGSFAIACSEIGIYARWEGGDLLLEMPVQERRWHEVKFTFSQAVELSVSVEALGVGERPQQFQLSCEGPAGIPGVDWWFAAAQKGQGHFNGRLEKPTLISNGEVVASWDFSIGIGTQEISDVSGHGHHGELFQNPTRGVCGHLWDGSVQNYLINPDHYGAIHFHEDDITDACWEDTVSLNVPDDLPSGQYALKIEQGASEDYVPFFVRAPEGKPGSKVAYLASTATYLAYANQRLGFTNDAFGDTSVRYANDAYLFAHPEIGFSHYEYHRDRSGVHFSSRLRPILNMKPRNQTWSFNADTHLTAWFEAKGESYDVITDEDLHLEGEAALADYRVVITGTHPEYYSTEMRDGLESWLGNGGRLMYMGGNGFYWRVAFQPGNPAIMEVRRAEDGTRAWIAEPGEYYHQFNGEYGGLWRRLGKPPNQLVGIGFAAQGFDGGTYYRVEQGALDPRVAFVTEGLETSDTWGNFGNQGGGAAGEEIDRWDPMLGSPEHAVIIATSENHRPGMLRVKEEFHMTEALRSDPNVRADMVFFEVPGGGAVFSTGSISYAGSLAHNNYNNEIETITSNVLQRFKDPEPFEMPG